MWNTTYQLRPALRDFEDFMITIHDNDFNIVASNDAANKTLGLPPSDGTIKCYQYYHGKEYPPAHCPSCKCMLTREAVEFEYFEPFFNKYIEIRALPRFDKEGEFIGIIHFVREITDKRSHVKPEM